MDPEKTPIERPRKKETLASKQEEKIRRWRLTHLRNRLPELSPQWWIWVGEMVGLVVLFLANLWLLLPFFGIPDQVNVFSAPLIPVLASLTENFVPFLYGIRIWLLAFLVFFPFSFYYFVREISGRKLTGFISAFIAILPIGVFFPLRISLGLLAQDGAHVASLTLTPLVSLLLLRFLRRGTFWSGILAALGAAVIALSSPIGFLVLSIFMGVITFSEMLLGRGRLKLIRFLVVIVMEAGFSAFWYNPKFVFLTINSPQGQVIKKTLANLLPVSFFLIPLLGVFGFLLFENRPQLQPVFIAFFLTIAFGVFSLGAGVVTALPSRFLPAFGISLAFLLGILIAWLFDFLRTSAKLKRLKPILPYRQIIAIGLIGLTFALVTITISFYGRNLWLLENTRVLGLTADQTVGIWDIKDKTTQLESTFGYAITVLTALGVAILRTRLGM